MAVTMSQIEARMKRGEEGYTNPCGVCVKDGRRCSYLQTIPPAGANEDTSTNYCSHPTIQNLPRDPDGNLENCDGLTTKKHRRMSPEIISA